jgi:hypothetical protein
MAIIFISILVIGVAGYLIWRGAKFDDSVIFSDKNENSIPPVPVLTQQTTCGCGRSPSGFCVGLHKLSEEEWAKHEDNPNKSKPKRARSKKVKE